MSEQSIDNGYPRYNIPKESIGFNTIPDYLPVSIGLYNKFLPNDYFKSLFKRVKNMVVTPKVSAENAYEHYALHVEKLKSIIIHMIERYKQRVKEENIREIVEDPIFKHEKHTIIDKLIPFDDIDDDAQEQNYTIKYITTEAHPKYTEENFIIGHIDKDLLELISKLYTLSLYSSKIPEEEPNSFNKFCENIIIHMRANLEVFYPKSIVNYTCFMYSIKGYPYCTPTKRIYTINNYVNNMDNKINNAIIYMKNTDALISYLYDIRFKEEEEAAVNEEWILRVAYCICIAFLAYRCEFIEYQMILHTLFGTRI